MKDESGKSLPSYLNVFIQSAGDKNTDGEGYKGRQVHVAKVTFGKKLRLFKIFSELLGKMGRKTSKTAGGLVIAASDMDWLAENGPQIFEALENNYMEIFSIGSDLFPQEVERLELDEAITLVQTIWKVNDFQKQIIDLGKIVGGGEPMMASGSKEPLPSSPPEPAGRKNKS